ncbi:MAG: glycoside hydrolase family 127 protein [Microbacterium arborescens]
MERTVPVSPRARPFEAGAVRLTGTSPFARTRDRMLHLARVYPVDRLLAVFRANSGLDTRGARPPGSWEDFGHPAERAWSASDYPGREVAQTANLLRGHYAGHFLSMLALAAATTDDPLLRAKVDEMVSGLGEVQAALAATGRFSHPGFLAAYGEWQFSRLEDFAPYGEIWAPYYTCHKIMAGLLDAHELTGSPRALEIVTGMAHWVSSRLERLDDDHRQRMWSLYIAGEFGGMNETLTRLSAVADEPRFLAAARCFDQRDLLEAGAARRDILDGMHANQHLPQLVGYVDEFEQTGERRYLDAAIGIFDQVVPGRMYAHGGTGESELWGPPGAVAADIGRRNAETCATYNLVKLTRRLFAHTLEPRFLDYAERAALNHILGSRRDADSDVSPEVTYMFPVDPGAVPEYDNVGTCCGGTGLENHVGHHEGIFLRGAEARAELWIGRYVPAELRWGERGLRVEIEQRHPFADRVVIRVHVADPDPAPLALHLRIPTWVAGAVRVEVDGEPVAADVAPGGFVTVERFWAGGETVELTLPMSLRSEAAIDDASLRSLAFGPHVLVARDDGRTTIERSWDARRMPGGAVRADIDDPAGSLAAEGEVRVAGLRFEPVWNGSDERYHLYTRAVDRTIGFAGIDTGVPVRRRADGSTLAGDLWREPAPRHAAELVERVVSLCRDGIDDAIVTAGEARTIVAAAIAAAEDTATTADPVGSMRDAVDRARTFSDGLRHGTDAVMPPSVEITVHPAPGASGWFTVPPTVTAASSDGAAVEIRVGDGPWSPFSAPVVVGREGVVVVEARAFGPDGRATTIERELSIDTAPPRSEARVRDLGSAVEITLVAADDVSGVDAIRWEGDGTFWATFHEAFVRALTDRAQVIEFAAVDRAGNEEPRQRLVLPPASKTDTIAIALTPAPDIARSETDS